MMKVKSAWTWFRQNFLSPSVRFSATLYQPGPTLKETGNKEWTGQESMEALPDTSLNSGLVKTLTQNLESLTSFTLHATRPFYSPTMSAKSGPTTETKFEKDKRPFVAVSFFDPEKGMMVGDMGLITDIIGENVVVELCGSPEYRGKFATVHFTETTEASRC